jgi:hypothetical protein
MQFGLALQDRESRPRLWSCMVGLTPPRDLDNRELSVAKPPLVRLGPTLRGQSCEAWTITLPRFSTAVSTTLQFLSSSWRVNFGFLSSEGIQLSPRPCFCKGLTCLCLPDLSNLSRLAQLDPQLSKGVLSSLWGEVAQNSASSSLQLSDIHSYFANRYGKDKSTKSGGVVERAIAKIIERSGSGLKGLQR